MDFGSATWDKCDQDEGLTKALFGTVNKQKLEKQQKKKSTKQIDQETKQAKEFMKTLKTVKTKNKMVSFDISDNESDSGDDISKRTKRNMKERQRKKRQKEAKNKIRTESKKKAEALDSDEELFAEIDEDDGESRRSQVNVPNVRERNDKFSVVKEMADVPRKIVKPKQKKIKKVERGGEATPENTQQPKKRKIPFDNPFTIETGISRSKKKKLKAEKMNENSVTENKEKKLKQVTKAKEKISAEKKSVKCKTKNSKKTDKMKSQCLNNSSVLNNNVDDYLDTSKENKQISDLSNPKNLVKLKTKTDVKDKKKKTKKHEKNGNNSEEKLKTVENLNTQKSPENTVKKMIKTKFNTKRLSDILSNKNKSVNDTPVKRDVVKSTTKIIVKTPSNVKKTLKERMTDQLNEARFRYLNEQLYTQTGPDAFKMFKADKDSFMVYHEGFQSQVSKWPVNPLDIIINQVKQLPASHVIADFGCGNADLAQNVSNKVRSFDLVPLNKYVTICDISQVPLSTKSVDVAVFCLSLMGTNLNDYVCEANRVLKTGGELKIAEVESRIADTEGFVTQIESFGFKLLNKDISHKMFHLFYFTKIKPCNKSTVQDIQLQACIYKKR